VGIDILAETIDGQHKSTSLLHVSRSELEFAQSISSQSCAFRLRGASSVAHISTIIEKSRASLDAAISATIFLIFGCVSFSLYALFSACTPATTIPYIPTLGSALFLLVIIPVIGLTMQMTDSDTNNMKRVPYKNDGVISCTRNERLSFFVLILAKAILPALLPQILHLIIFGSLVLKFDADFVALNCPAATNWVDIVRCDGMKDYTGSVKLSASSIVLAQFILCVIVSSAAFVHRFLPIKEQFPWESNFLWLYSLLFAFGVLVIFVVLSTTSGTTAALPWYFYILSITTPFLCLIWVEFLKHSETKQEQRAEKLRRLQFETRLGAWSPR
jgi:magnesium-transporting ATPase (P-type)